MHCQSLLVSPINYTLTTFAHPCAPCSHDALNRSLRGERITPRLVWEHVRGQARVHPRVAPCCVMIRCSTRTPRSPSHSCGDSIGAMPKTVIKGLGGVTCVDVNPDTDQVWLIHSRIYRDPTAMGKASSITSTRC